MFGRETGTHEASLCKFVAETHEFKTKLWLLVYLMLSRRENGIGLKERLIFYKFFLIVLALQLEIAIGGRSKVWVYGVRL
jgi:hypothetical protein